MSDTYLQLADAEYDCGQCGVTHTYTTGEPYELHMDLMIGNKRWVYQDVTVAAEDADEFMKGREPR